MKSQYQYLHRFAEKIASERDTISIDYIKSRAHLYGNAANNTLAMVQAGQVLTDKLPWLPGDGSTECLINCKCRWELEIIGKDGVFNIVQAVWHLGEAEHCDDCVDRDEYVVTLNVYKTIPIPAIIGYAEKELRLKGGPGSGFAGHAGRPGLVGGSAAVYIGAKPLQHYLDIIKTFPLVENPGNEYRPAYMYRDVPYPYEDRMVLVGLENESRNHTVAKGYPEEFDEYVRQAEEQFRKQLAESDVFMRITAENLEEALKDGAFENTFTSKHTDAGIIENKISYKTYLRHRKEGELEALGVPTAAKGDERPIYGYWSKEGGFADNANTWLKQYGSIAVEFDKDKIANELTFTDSDSLDYSDRVRSSDWRNPSILSSFGITNGTYMTDKISKGPNDAMYWEAQIYNKSISNIKAIHSKSPLPKSLTDLLDKAGIPWSIQS
jgi:hypothetical protein